MKHKKIFLSTLLVSSVFMMASLASCKKDTPTVSSSTGSQSYTGQGAPDDAFGYNGDTYRDVTTNNVYEKQNGVWVLIQNGQPEQLSGEGAPNDALGNNGDFYTDTKTDDYYQKQNGKWVLIKAGQQIVYHTVTFDLAGGTLSNGATTIPNQEVEDGRWATEPSERPSKPHSTFAGWYSGPDTKWVFTQSIYGDLVLTAHYNVVEEAKVTVTIDPNNGEDPYTVDTFAGDTLRVAFPEKDGYNFSGWVVEGTNEPFTGLVSSSLNGKRIIAQFTKAVINVLYRVESNGEATITGVRDIESANVVIPNTIDGRKVTSIADNAFNSRINLLTVTIPASVKYVSGKAFAGARKIQSVVVESTSPYYTSDNGVLYTAGKTELVYCPPKYSSSTFSFVVPATVQKIGNYAFYGHYDAGVSSINFNEGLVEIGDYAFSFNEKITSLVFPSTLRKIGSHAFWGNAMDNDDYISPQGVITNVQFNNGLEEIGEGAFTNQYFKDTFTLPSSLKVLGAYAFTNCTAIKKFIVPRSLEVFGKNAFAGATGIMEVDVEAGCQNFVAEDNILYTADMKKVVYCPSGRTETTILPEGVEEIGDYAFYMVDRCLTYILPSTLTRIGDCAFAHTYDLKTFEIPDSVTQLGKDVFDRSGLSSVTIGSGLTEISAGAFWETKLTSVTIPANIKKIGDNAFNFCQSLKEVKFEEGLEEIGVRAFSSSFKGTSAVTLNLPHSLVTIGEGAFALCPAIQTVNFGRNLQNIGINVFNLNDTSKLTTLTVSTANPYLVAENNIIYNREKTELILGAPGYAGSLNIPEGVKVVADYAFYGCRNVNNITFPNSLEEIGEGAFTYTKSPALSFGPNLRLIKEGAFSSTWSTNAVTFSEGIQEIGKSAFWGSNIGALVLPNSLKVIGESAFAATEIGMLDLGEGVEVIGTDAFYNCRKLAGTIKIPASVRTLGEGIFLTNTALITDFDCADSNNFSSFNGLLMDKLQTTVFAYANGNPLTDLVMPSTVREIKPYAMVNAINLHTLVLSSSLETIGLKAFVNLTNVASLTIPSSVTYIGEQAFSGMRSNQVITFECSADYAYTYFAQYFDSTMATIHYQG